MVDSSLIAAKFDFGDKAFQEKLKVPGIPWVVL
jgi:hypothetical protein